MESMTCDIAIKLYDRALSYDVNSKDPELWLITNAEVETMNELDAARVNVHDFSSNFLDGDSSIHKFQGTDMKFKGTEATDHYWANTIIVYVSVAVPRDEIEELVIALAEEFAGKEASVEV